MKFIKNRYAAYISILIGEVFLILLCSSLTGVRTENTWLGAIGVTVIFATLGAMLFDIAMAVKRKRPGISIFIYIVIIVLIAGIIINYILLLLP